MRTFKLTELQKNPEELLRNTGEGHLSLVTSQGEPAFVTVPVDERLIATGLLEVIAVKLYDEGVLSLSKAASFSRQSIERFLESLAAAGVDTVAYDPAELDQELATFA